MSERPEQPCEHESSVVFTATGGWIKSYTCACAKCGQLATFYPDEHEPRARREGGSILRVHSRRSHGT